MTTLIAIIAASFLTIAGIGAVNFGHYLGSTGDIGQDVKNYMLITIHGAPELVTDEDTIKRMGE